MPRGRKPTLNWQESKGQYTCTITGAFHRLGKDKEAAKRQFDFLLRKAGLGEMADPAIPFADVVDQWLDHVKEYHDPDRYRLCKARLEEFVTVIGEKYPARDLRASQVEGWLHFKKLAPGTLRLYKAMILAPLNWAADSKKGNLIAANPLKGTLRLPEGGSRGKEAVWPRALFEQVLRVANPAFADVVRALAWTGARPSTVCKVEARHYRRQWRLWDVEDLYRDRETKRKYVTKVRLLPQAVPLVERLNEEHPEGPIFLNANGRPWTSDTLGVYFYELRHKFHDTKSLSWPEGVTLYGLRHTFATAFLREHPNEIEYLRVLLGHRDYKMILKHYGHLVDQHEKINRKLEGLDPFA